MTVALLPLLWAGGVLPSLLDLLLWSLEQAMVGGRVPWPWRVFYDFYGYLEFLWLFPGIFYDFYGI